MCIWYTGMVMLLKHSGVLRSVLKHQIGTQVLGLDPAKQPGEDEIRRAKRRLCLLTHTDKTDSPGARVAFNAVIEAADTLLDASRRARYDADMRRAQTQAAAAAAGATGGEHSEGVCVNIKCVSLYHWSSIYLISGHGQSLFTDSLFTRLTYLVSVPPDAGASWRLPSSRSPDSKPSQAPR